MINSDWSIIVITLSPSIAILGSILGIFDIRKESAEKLFEEYLEKLRDEKIKIWKKLITIRNNVLPESEVNDQLLKILEDEERYEDLNIILKSCRKCFDYYYSFLFCLFFVGIFLAILSFKSPDFFSKESVMILLDKTSIVSVLLTLIGMGILIYKKKKVRDFFGKISSSSINL